MGDVESPHAISHTNRNRATIAVFEFTGRSVAILNVFRDAFPELDRGAAWPSFAKTTVFVYQRFFGAGWQPSPVLALIDFA